MNHPDVLTGPLSLADFSATVGGMVERAGKPIYKINIRVRRDGEWILAGMMDLLHDEWLRLYAVLNAHEAAHGNPTPRV